MLIIETIASVATAQGEPLSTQGEVARRQVETFDGVRGHIETRPVYGSTRVLGLTVGYPDDVPAPIDVQPGDVVRFKASFEDPGVFDVKRAGKPIYQSR